MDTRRARLQSRQLRIAVAVPHDGGAWRKRLRRARALEHALSQRPRNRRAAHRDVADGTCACYALEGSAVLQYRRDCETAERGRSDLPRRVCVRRASYASRPAFRARWLSLELA